MSRPPTRAASFFTVHFCNSTVSQRGNFAALLFFLWTPTLVGYSTLTVNKGYTIMACNFEGVDGNALPINTAFPYAEGMTKGNSINKGDNLQIMKEDGDYDIYYMSNGKNAKSQTVEGLEGKWAKGGTYVPTTDTIAAGKAFWYISQGHIADSEKTPFAIQVAGQVMSQTAPTRELAASYMIIGSPYPVDISLNGGIVVTGATQGNSINKGDNLQIMKEDGDYDIYYMSNGKNAKSQTVDGLEGKWAKGGTYVPTTDKFPAGGAAWYVRQGAEPVSVQFINPIAE